MICLNLNYIEILNSQNVLLHGVYSGKNNKKCLVYIPGLGADYSSSIIPKKIYSHCIKNNYDFLCGSNQGNGLMSELLIYNDVKSVKNGGASYENYDNWYPDIKAWIDYVYDYKEIIVVAHSLGCNKIIDFLNKDKNNKISRIILLSPQDIKYLISIGKHEGMYEEAINNKDNKLLSKIFLGFCYISTNTFLDFYNNEKINNIPYLSSKKYEYLKNLTCCINIVIGNNDKKNIDFKSIFSELCNECSNVSFDIINGANHNYSGKEDELIKMIFDKIN